MKILHVFDHSIPLHSGYTFRSRAILEQQRSAGWKTVHVTSAKQGACAAPEETVDGLTFHRTAPARGLGGRLPVVNQLSVVRGLAQRLEEVVEREVPDILHAHSPALNGLAALQVGRRRGLPVVYECRAFWEDAAVDHGTSKEWGLRYRLTRRLETRVFRRADAITTICEGLRCDILARGIPPGRVTVVPNAVNVENFQMGKTPDRALAEKLGIFGRPVIGFVGSFYAYEGLTVLLDAVPRLREWLPDIRVLLVGGGPEEERLWARSGELGLQDTVVFTGRVPHGDVQRYYDLVDVFVYPRLHMRLTDLVTPLKPLEAMAQGKLVTASDVGGHRELIEEGMTGDLFPAGDPTALAECVWRVFERQVDWNAQRERAREFVETDRNWAVSVARYGPVYRSLLGHRPEGVSNAA